MTAAGEYQRVLTPTLVRLPAGTLGGDYQRDLVKLLAQALAADPGVRAAVEREALERAAQAIEEVGPIEWALYGQEAGQEAARIVRDLMLRKDGE